MLFAHRVHDLFGGEFIGATIVAPRAGEMIEVVAGLEAGERIAHDPVRAGLLGASPAAL